MKNKYKILSLVLIFVLAVTFYFKDQIAKAASSAFYVNGAATTTVVYLNPTASGGTATSSYLLAQTTPGYNSNVDVNDVFIFMVASSSSSGVSWKEQYSNGASCYTNENGCDWYEEDNVSTSGATITHATSTNTWIPGKTATSTKVIAVTPYAAVYKRLLFFVTPGATNSAINISDTAKLNVTGQ